MKTTTTILILALLTFPAHGALGDPFKKSHDNGFVLEGKRVSAAIITQEDGESCLLDVRGRSDLLPSFLKPAERNSTSLNNLQLPICGVEEEFVLEASVEHFAYNPEGVQVALLPFAAFGVLMAVQCVFGAGVGVGGVVSAAIGIETDFDGDDFSLAVGLGGLGAAGFAAAIGSTHPLAIISAGALGAQTVAVVALCGGVTYLLLKDKEELKQ